MKKIVKPAPSKKSNPMDNANKGKKTPMAPKKYAQGGMIKKGKC
jgi:hypothetical protein